MRELFILYIFLFSIPAIAQTLEDNSQTTVENVLDSYMQCLLPKSAMGTLTKDTLEQVDEIMPLCDAALDFIFKDNTELLAKNKINLQMLRHEGQKLLAGRIIKDKLMLTKNPQDTIYHYRYCMAIWFEIGLPFLAEAGIDNIINGVQTECYVGPQILESQLASKMPLDKAQQYVVAIKRMAVDDVLKALKKIERKFSPKKPKHSIQKTDSLAYSNSM